MAPVFSDSQLLGWDPKYPGDYFLDGRAVGQDSLDLVLEKWFQLIDGSYFLNEILFNWGKTYTYTFDSESFSVGVPSESESFSESDSTSGSYPSASQSESVSESNSISESFLDLGFLKVETLPPSSVPNFKVNRLYLTISPTTFTATQTYNNNKILAMMFVSFSLTSGTLYQDSLGTAGPPTQSLLDLSSTLHDDSFFALGEFVQTPGTSSPQTTGIGMQVPMENVAWYKQDMPLIPVTEEDIPIAQLTLSNDANGTFEYLYGNDDETTYPAETFTGIIRDGRIVILTRDSRSPP